jgi:hypothetical protein
VTAIISRSAGVSSDSPIVTSLKWARHFLKCSGRAAKTLKTFGMKPSFSRARSKSDRTSASSGSPGATGSQAIGSSWPVDADRRGVVLVRAAPLEAPRDVCRRLVVVMAVTSSSARSRAV